MEPALRAEFLVAQHAAALSKAYQVALERKLAGQILSQRDIQSIIDDSLSFDPTTAEELEREVTKRLSQHEDRSNSSFFHFLKGIVTSEGPETKTKLEQKLRELRYANSIPTHTFPVSEFLSQSWFTELIGKMEAQPHLALFPVPEELSDEDSSHPSPRKRIAYLWRNFVDRQT